MEIFPYLTSYLIVYSLVINLLFFFMPAPYGKFSWKKTYLSVPNDLFKPFIMIGFVSFWPGYYENEEWHTDMPCSTRGWAIWWWLTIYFTWRILAFPLLSTILAEKDSRGGKWVDVWWILPYVGFYLPAGFYWRRASVLATRPFEPYEYVLMVLLVVLFLLNVYQDIINNRRRNQEGIERDYLGKYLPLDKLYDNFESMKGLYSNMALPPNYAFEITHWFIFMFLSFTWEGVWFFCCMFLFIVSRGIWQRNWYYTHRESSTVYQQVMPFVKPNVKGKITF